MICSVNLDLLVLTSNNQTFQPTILIEKRNLVYPISSMVKSFSHKKKILMTSVVCTGFWQSPYTKIEGCKPRVVGILWTVGCEPLGAPEVGEGGRTRPPTFNCSFKQKKFVRPLYKGKSSKSHRNRSYYFYKKIIQVQIYIHLWILSLELVFLPWVVWTVTPRFISKFIIRSF